jgi:phosphoenolpyruvate carboxykinase (GTP)
MESLSWNHGVFLGASMTSETTAAAIGEVGKIRHDPFAMLPFCGYNMGDYFAHWIEMGKKSAKMPKIFHVNWFRKGVDGKFLWPGFGHNIYVLKWIFESLDGAPNADLSPVGYLPKKGIFEPSILTMIDQKEYLTEVADLENYFQKFGSHLPPEISSELAALKDRLCAS